MNRLAVLSDPEFFAGIEKRDIPDALGALETAKARLLSRLLEPTAARMEPDAEDRLISVERAAELTEFTKQYLYDLIRRGKLPAMRTGKYLRVRLSDLKAWIDKHTEKPLDRQVYRPYTSNHGPKRTTRNQKAARTHSETNGRQDRRPKEHRGEVGAGRIADIRTRRTVDAADCRDGNQGPE